MSIKDATDNIKTVLAQDAALNAWIATTFPGKTLKVRKAFKRRQEVNTSELPLIMITVPARRHKTETAGSRIFENTVTVYTGLCHNGDRELAPDLVDHFEGLVEAAVLRDPTRGGYALNTHYAESSNDEGAFHPNYFSALEFLVFTETFDEQSEDQYTLHRLTMQDNLGSTEEIS